MTTTRIALYAAAAAAAAWTAKAVAIGLSGGLGLSPAETPLFLTGLACYLVGVVATGVALVGRREQHGLASRVAAGVGALVVGVAVGFVTTWLVTLVQPAGSDAWVWSEAGLWLMAALLLAVTASLSRATAVDPRDRAVATAS